MLSSTKKLRFISKGKTIEVDVVNARDQAVKTPKDSNLYALWKKNENRVEIEFYYNEVEKICLYLAENLIKAKQVLN